MDGMVKDYLTKTVNEKSEGLYSITIKSVDVSFWNSSIEFENVRLKINKKKWEEMEADSLPAQLEFNIPNVNITDIDWWEFARNKKILIGEVMVTKPKINYHLHLTERKSQSASFNQVVGNIIGRFSKDFNIHKTTLKDAKVKIQLTSDDLQLKKSFDKLNVIFEDTQINKETIRAKDRILFSKNLFFSLGKFDLSLPGIAALDLSDITVNSSDSTLTFHEMHFSKGDELSFEAKEISFAKLGVKEYLEDNIIHSTKLEFVDPVFKQKKNKELKLFNLNFKDKISELVNTFTPELLLDTIQFTNASAEITKKAAGKDYDQLDKFESVNFTLYNFNIKEDTLSDSIPPLFSDYVSFRAKKISTTRSDSSMYAYVLRPSFESSDSVITFRNIKFRKGSNAKVEIPSVTFIRPDWQKYWNTGRLNVGEVEVDKPVFDYYIKRTSFDSTKRTIAQMISTFSTGVEVDHVEIYNARFRRVSENRKKEPVKFSADNIYMSLDNITLVPGMSERNTMAEIFSDLDDVTMSTMNFQVGDYITLNSAKVKTFGHHKSLMLNGVDFKRSNRLNMKLDTLLVNEIRWDDFLHNPDNPLFIKEIRLDDPAITFTSTDADTIVFDSSSQIHIREQLPRIISEFSSGIEIKSFGVSSASLRHIHVIDSTKSEILQQARNIDYSIEDFFIPSDTNAVTKFIFSEHQNISIKDYWIKAPKSGYKIGFKSLSTTSHDSSAVVKNISINKGANVLIRIPEIVFNRTGWNQYWHTHGLELKNILVQNPSFVFLSEADTANKNKFDMDSVQQELSKIVKNLASFVKTDSLIIQGGTFDQVLKTAKNDTVSQRADNISVVFRNLQIDSNLVKSTSRFLFSDNILLRLNNYSFSPGDKDVSFSVKWLEGNVLDTTLVLHNFVYSKKGVANVTVPIAVLSEINLRRYLETNELKLSNIRLNQSKVDLKLDLNRNSEKTVLSTIYEITERICKNLSADSLIVYESDVNATLTDSSHIMTHEFDKLNFTLSNVFVDPGNREKKEDRVLIGENFTCSGKRYLYNDNDSTYRFNTGTWTAASATKSFSINNLKYKPYHDDNDFMSRLKFREPRFALDVANIQSRGFDFLSLVNKKEVLTDKIIVNKPEFVVFEDKNVPRDSSRFPAMPNDIFRNLETRIKINNIEVHDGKVQYKQRELDKTEIGSINFTKTRMSFLKITNDTSDMTNLEPAFLDCHALFMDTGEVKIRMSIPLLSEKLNCSYDFRLGRMNADTINEWITPNTDAELKSGEIIKVTTEDGNIEMRDTLVTGTLLARYTAFRVRLFKNKNKRRFLTWLSNLALVTNNHKKTGTIYYVREPYDGFIKFVWRGVQSGLEDTILPGFLKDKEKKKQVKERQKKLKAELKAARKDKTP